MRVLLATLALCLIVLQPALAKDSRIMVHEVHSYVSQVNSALNNPNIAVGRNFLVRNVAEGALFETSVKMFHPGHPSVQDVWWKQTYGPYYYRYPYAYYPYYTTSGYEEMGKWEMISNFENKKRLIVGYQPEYVITGIKMRPDATQAVVDLDLKEYSTRYAPYSPYLTSGVLHANSKCKAYLVKHEGQIVMTRMDCNTHTQMPF
jgi:hypothetical protein